MFKHHYRLHWVAPLAIALSLAAQVAPAAKGADWTADQLSMPFPPAASEKQLIETLRSAGPAEKAVACKQLAIHGSNAAVPELAKLLSDEQLASWARIALEAIPDPAADAALVEAAKSLQGELLVGTINSIGARRSAGAIDVLADRIGEEDSEVASASAVALGKIGGEQAFHVLHNAYETASPEVRSAIAEGGILVAERLLAEGDKDRAATVYDLVCKADVPKQRILEATRGAIIARGEQGTPLLLAQLQSDDPKRFALGLMVARELGGRKVGEALSAELSRAKPERAALIVMALGDRDDAELPQAVLQAARGGDQRVRVAAIEVVGRKGDWSAVPALLEIAAEADAELSQAAKSALAELPGSEVDTELARRLADATGQPQVALVETVGQRRIAAAVSDLVKALESSDESVRSAALAALGATAGPKDLAVLISQVKDSKDAASAEASERALLAASIRMPDREATAAELAAAMPSMPTETQARLLRVLGAMGGPKALQTIAESVKGGDAQLQDVGTRVLGEWMTADAGPVLYEIAATDHKFKIRALRGYLRIARQLNLEPEQRLKMCAEALKIAKRPEERRLVLEVLGRVPSPRAIEIAGSLLDDTAMRPQAAETIVVIAEKIKDQDPAAASAAAQQALTAGLADGFTQRAKALVKQN